MSSSLRRLQERYAAALDEQIEETLGPEKHTNMFYGMMRYQLGYVDERLEPSPGAGGKRFRPALCLSACEAVGGRWEEALPVASGIELLHNFSLIHDDIEDRDPARHHRPTVWKLWGEAQAINAGDGMFALAWACVLATNSGRPIELARRFMEVSLALTEGQHLDMSFERRQDVTPDEYLRMISLKTGAIISYSLWSGAQVGGADDETCGALSTFGAELGRAFQIHDDVMGIWGAQAATGKEAAKDLHNRKKTLPVLQALQHASQTERAELERFFGGERDDLEAIMQILESARARERSVERVASHLDAALAALERAEMAPSWRSELRSLALEITGQ